MIGLLQAVDDPELLGAAFRPHPKQRDLLERLDAGPRTHVWCIGRRGGKSLCGAVAALHNVTMRPDLDACMRPGEVRFATAVACNIQQARIFVRAAKSVAEASPILSGLISGMNEDSISFELPSGTRTCIAAFPSSSRGGRGWPISFLFSDEAAFMRDDSSADDAQVAGRIYSALAPSTAQFADLARICISSTPNGNSGFFAEMVEKSRTGELPGSCLTHLPTWEVNPSIPFDGDLLQAERLRAPDEFDSEYGASLLSAGGQFLDFDRFEFVHRGELRPGALVPGSAIAGLDPAFAGHDEFGVAVLGRLADSPERWALALVDGFSPPRSHSFEDRHAVESAILSDVAAICHRYHATATTDQFMSRQVVDRLTREGIYCEVRSMGAASKTLAYNDLRALLYQGALEVYDDVSLIAEMRRLRTKYSAGSAAVVVPRVAHSHGDRCQALALACAAASARGGYGGNRLPGGAVVAGIGRLARGLL